MLTKEDKGRYLDLLLNCDDDSLDWLILQADCEKRKRRLLNDDGEA